MKDEPLISVVLPVYNVEEYILEAVDSVLKQTVTDFELFVIDDASGDRTLEVVKSIQDPRIKVIEKKENAGLVDSLNLGFELAKGKYVARMDGDDISAPERFEKQLSILEKYPQIKACGCWLQNFGGNDKIIKHKEKHEEIQANLLVSNSISLCSAMLEKDAYKSFRFSEDMMHVEDYDFWARTAWSCEMYNIQEVLYYYRVHDEQVSNKYLDFQHEGDVKIKRSLFKKLQYDENVYSDSLVSKLLNQKGLTLQEIRLTLDWFRFLISNNSSLKIYDPAELERVVSGIRRRLVFDLYFTNRRSGISRTTRKKVFPDLPFQDQKYVLKGKMREKFKLIRKAIKSRIQKTGLI